MPIELRAWLNPQSYSNSYSTAGIAREAAYFTPVPEPVTADPDYITAEAREYEAAGYDSAIWPQSATWPDVTVTATWALARTQRLRVVLAHRPGTQAPTAAARALATLDRLSAGRTGLHLILGSGADLARDGDHTDRAARYRRAAEYLEIFTGVLTRDQPFDFDGEFYQVRGAFSGVKPVQSPRPVISLPAESDDGIALAARYADVLAFHGTSRAAAAAKITQARGIAQADGASGRGLRFWINLNMIVGESDAAAQQHVRELEQAIRRLQEFRSGNQVQVRSIREDRFSDLDRSQDQWQDDALYLGLTALSRATPALVGSPSTIADAVLAYNDLGVSVVSLGSHVTSERDAELRRETLQLIRQAVTVRDAANWRAA